ncbi:hypothetical protein ANCCEY_13855 [Ancylostoma ceylanicum]|uniref:Uncharacterized protein n=1 Tax=Ancylostoma ceylanicum TaxID=53326 RepID=A0A0D6LHC4_9BILA|nr:hypothetical protein ANCCEY_13855 [Ancylostoma ceylanicum]
MYTVPAFFMVILSVICCFIVQFLFKEDYAGILKEEDKKVAHTYINRKIDSVDPFMVIPKFDVIPAAICIYLWIVSCMVATNIEVYLFKISGYKYIMVTQICTLGLALFLTIVFYKRLVPLKLKPALGKAAKYKNGVFYTM